MTSHHLIPCRYVGEGLEVGELVDALSNVQELVKDYTEVEKDSTMSEVY